MTKIEKGRILKLATYLEGPVAAAHKRTKGRKFNMGSWASDAKIGVTRNLCGTSGCALGFASVVFKRQIRLSERGERSPWEPLYTPVLVRDPDVRGQHVGIAFFGMTREQACHAFVPERSDGMGTVNRTPKQAAKVLRTIAAHGN